MAPGDEAGAGDARRRAGSARAAGGVRQLSARTARDTRHEDRVDDTLAAYFRAAGRAGRIRVAARRKAARVITTARRKARAITEAAERDAAGPGSEAARCLRELRDLAGGKAGAAELCGLSLKEVTAILAAPAPAACPDDAAEDSTVGEEGDDDCGSPEPGGPPGPVPGRR